MAEPLNELLRAAADGDDAAFSRLTERYAPLIRAMSARYAASFAALGPGAPGEQDLEQEARLALFRAAESYDRAQSGVSFGLYAKIVIRNRFVSELRRSRAAARRENAAAAAAAADPLRELFFAETDSDLAGRIRERLSPYERQVFDQYVGGLSVGGIARALGREEKSVSNAMFRIRQKIRALLRPGEKP